MGQLTGSRFIVCWIIVEVAVVLASLGNLGTVCLLEIRAQGEVIGQFIASLFTTVHTDDSIGRVRGYLVTVGVSYRWVMATATFRGSLVRAQRIDNATYDEAGLM